LPECRHFTRLHLADGRAFAAFDRLLETARTGPLYLAHPEIAGMVSAHLKEQAQNGRVYDLHAFVVMPNHVHALISPVMPLPAIMKLVKGGTARRANQILNTPGQTFWQEEFFDHCVRNGAEFQRIRNYIEYNPVRAGLAASLEEFSYSSAWRGGSSRSERD
jgi:REP element-mobilizing transposase RayT